MWIGLSLGEDKARKIAKWISLSLSNVNSPKDKITSRVAARLLQDKVQSQTKVKKAIIKEVAPFQVF
jgi:hypothetical protein